MTDPLFLSETLPLPLPVVGGTVVLDGPEARHAVVVRRIRVGESVLISDGRGRGVRGRVTSASPQRLAAEVLDQVLLTEPGRRYVVAQALAKGDRSELAVAMLTEVVVECTEQQKNDTSIVYVRFTYDDSVYYPDHYKESDSYTPFHWHGAAVVTTEDGRFVNGGEWPCLFCAAVRR